MTLLPPQTSNSFLVQQEIQKVQQARENQYYVKMTHGSKIYPNTDSFALKNLTFGAEVAKIFCLLGPNGAGKTTTLKSVANTISLTSGSIQVNHQELFGITDPNYAPGICLQSDMLWDFLTVEQHLKIYALFKGISREDVGKNVDDLIHILGLEPFRNRQVEHLSGGTKRKLSVAVAVISAPKLIILDEPTTGVDPLGRNQIWTLLKNLTQKRRSTVLISTHYMEDAELVADKLGILVNGRLKTIGNVADLRTAEEQHFLTIEGISGGSGGFGQILDSEIPKILPEASLTENLTEEKRVYKIPSAAMKFTEVCRQLEAFAQDNKISGFSINTKTLEQVFLEYAKEQNAT